MAGGEVPGDRVGAGIQPVQDELVVERDDQLDRCRRRRPWARVRPSRARLKRRVPLGAMPSNKLIDPRAGNAVGDSDLTRAAAFDDDSGDDNTGK